MRMLQFTISQASSEHPFVVSYEGRDRPCNSLADAEALVKRIVKNESWGRTSLRTHHVTYVLHTEND